MNKIPSWMVEHQKKVLLRHRRIQEKATAEAALAFPVRTGFAQARGWRMLGQPTFSCVPDAEHPWDPAVIQAIWKFDPAIVPVWVKYALVRSGDEGASEIEVIGRHVVARHVDNLVNEAYPFACEMPSMPCQGLRFKRPNVLVFQVEGDGGVPMAGIGPYADMDWEIHNKLLARHVQNLSAEAQAKMEREAKEAVLRNSQDAHDADDKVRRADLQKFVDKKLSEVSEVELKEHFLGEKTPEHKPFVQVGSTPPEA